MAVKQKRRKAKSKANAAPASKAKPAQQQPAERVGSEEFRFQGILKEVYEKLARLSEQSQEVASQPQPAQDAAPLDDQSFGRNVVEMLSHIEENERRDSAWVASLDNEQVTKFQASVARMMRELDNHRRSPDAILDLDGKVLLRCLILAQASFIRHIAPTLAKRHREKGFTIGRFEVTVTA